MVSMRVLEPLFLALREAGQDPTALLRAAHAEPEPGAARLPESGVASLCALAVSRSGDTAFTLRAGLNSAPSSLGVLGYVLQNTPTVGDAWLHLQRYWRLLHDAPLFSIEQGELASVLQFRADPSGDPEAYRPLIEYLLTFLLRLSGSLVGGAQRGNEFLQAIEFRHARPDAAALAAYAEGFHTADLRFDAPRNAIHFQSRLLQQPVSYADPGLLDVLARQADAELHRLQDEPAVVSQVKAVLRQCLPGKLPGLPQLAAECAMSRATLQRHLAAAGSSYKEIVDALRQEMASSMLAEPQYSIGEIAFALGYADTAAFHHAYKRWTGLTPKQARAS